MTTRLLLVLASAFVFSGCSIFEWGKYDSFGEWYIGPAGITKMMEGTRSDEGLKVDRPPIYGHFRLPEVILQPAGGLKYPRRRTITNASLGDAIAATAEAQNQARATGYGSASYTRVTIITDGPEDSLNFDWNDAGLVELIPYRTYFSDKGIGYKIGITLVQPLNYTMTAIMSIFFRAPVYVFHDSLKTVTIPFAALYYYATAEDEAAEPAASAGDGADTTDADATGEDATGEE